MKNNRIFFLAICYVLIINSAWSQQANPFDITHRGSEDNTILTSANETVDTATILNQNSNQSVIANVEGSIVQDSIVDVPEDVADTPEESPKTSFLDAQQQKLMEQNPFNVSHIPLKRNSSVLKKKLVKQDSPVKEEASTKNKVEPATKNTVTNGLKTNKFIFWLLLLQLLLISSLLGINREIIRKIYRSISNDNFAKLVSRDYNGGYNALFVILYILFFLSLSIFIYLLFRNYYGLNGFANYSLVLISVIGIYAFRHIFQGVSGYVFPFGKTSSYFNFMIILFNSFLGLILIPINIVVAYAPSGVATLGIYLGIASVVILYLLRFLRGSLHAYTYVRNYLFHFFLYLCTCEFAPVLILVKFLSKSFIN